MIETINTEETIKVLKAKNIKFNIIDEFKALNYLKYCNNYYNIISYETYFEKYYINNKFVDKYVNLDFAYLIDLSEIDFELKSILFKMVTIIEHHLKLRILNLFECYKIKDEEVLIHEFLNEDINDEKRVYNNILNKVDDIDIENIPINRFFELITFGDLIKFYNYFIKKYKIKKEYKNIYILKEVKNLRNEVCHNGNILSTLNKKEKIKTLNYDIYKYLNKCHINKDNYIEKLKNSTIKMLTYTLYMFNYIVVDKNIKDKIKSDINDLFYKRVIKNNIYYKNNKFLKSVYDYFNKIIETSYKINKKFDTLYILWYIIIGRKDIKLSL